MAKASPLTCCGEPVIHTSLFGSQQTFCRKCRRLMEVMQAGMILQPVGWTPELQMKMDENKKWFKEMTKDIIPPTLRKADCPNCQPNENQLKKGLCGPPHFQHASPEENRAANEAKRRLFTPEPGDQPR